MHLKKRKFQIFYFFHKKIISKLVQPSDSHEKPYNANEDSLYVELVIVVDNDMYNHFDKRLDKIHKYCKDTVHIVNSVSDK